MKYKKILSFICALAMLSSVNANASVVDVTMNGKSVDMGASGVLVNDYIMVPIRGMAEAFQYKVNWNGEENKVTLLKVDKEIDVYVNSTRFVMSGEEKELPCETKIIGGKTYVSVSLFKQITDVNMVWDYDNNNLALTSDSFPSEDGIFALPPEDLTNLQKPYINDFMDSYDIHAVTVSNNPTDDNFAGKSEYTDGWYQADGKIQAVGGSNAYTGYNWVFKLSNFFKGYKAGKYKIKFKVRSLVNDASKAASKLNMRVISVGDSVASGTVVSPAIQYGLCKISDTDWKDIEFEYEYSGKCTDAGAGYDSYALVLRFFVDVGGWYAIDDVEITPVE